MRELSLFPVREDQHPVRLATKIGKKRQGESNDQEKRKKIFSPMALFLAPYYQSLTNQSVTRSFFSNYAT